MGKNEIYIRQDAPSDNEEEYVYYRVLIDGEDNEYYYGHYESNGLKFTINKKDVFQLNNSNSVPFLLLLQSYKYTRPSFSTFFNPN